MQRTVEHGLDRLFLQRLKDFSFIDITGGGQPQAWSGLTDPGRLIRSFSSTTESSRTFLFLTRS